MIVLYDPPLVVLSIVVAIVGSLTALASVSARPWSNNARFAKLLAVGNGAMILGSSIWAMHFIAMMAVQFPITVHYDPLETALSLLLAIIVTGIALFVVSGHKDSRLHIPAAGVLMGLGIAGMHYLGMAAIMGCGIAYDWFGVALSVVIAILASTAALWFTFATRGVVMTLLGGVVMGLAIASMHYTAMFATHFPPLKDAIFLSEPLYSQEFLAYSLALAMTFICIVNAIILVMARFGGTTRTG